MNSKRLKASFTTENIESCIKKSQLQGDMLGCAIDKKDMLLYILMISAKNSTYWGRFSFLSNIEPWEGKDNVAIFAQKNSFIFLPGDTIKDIPKDDDISLYLLPRIKELILKGGDPDDLEIEFFLQQDFRMLDTLIQNRNEITTFAKAIKKIKARIAENVLREGRECQINFNWLGDIEPHKILVNNEGRAQKKERKGKEKPILFALSDRILLVPSGIRLRKKLYIACKNFI